MPTPDPGTVPASEPVGDALEIDDAATLQLVYDPLRFRLLVLTSQPRTVTELAEAVGMPRSRLYYHVHRLEERGLVEVAGEQTVGRRVERSYRARYSSYRLSPSLRGHPLARSHAPFVSSMHDLADKHLQAAAQGMQTPGLDDQPTLVLSLQRRLGNEQVEEFVRRMTELAQEFAGEDAPEAPGDGGVWYASLLLVTPVTAPFGDDHAVVLRLDDDSLT